VNYLVQMHVPKKCTENSINNLIIIIYFVSYVYEKRKKAAQCGERTRDNFNILAEYPPASYYKYMGWGSVTCWLCSEGLVGDEGGGGGGCSIKNILGIPPQVWGNPINFLGTPC
jgi:hypothetical protein